MEERREVDSLCIERDAGVALIPGRLRKLP